MKEQPQQPMAPMAFYPTWQADPSQGWQNQFIQQIPQNTPAITSLNSIEFQPQTYSYQPNGYVQTGLGFEPNYGRTYATPVQRYEFQTNQMSPINQVSLQSVSFAPAVTYTSQVSTGSTPMLLSSQNDLNKTVSGNDMPGYPRVNSVPPRSLNCNGYSGDYSGNQNHNITNNVQPQQQQQHNQHQQQQMQHHQQQHNNSNQMHPPQVPQSPNRSNMSTPVSQHMMVPTGPGSNHMSQLTQSPNSLQNNGNQQQIQMQSPNHHHTQLQTTSRYPSHPGTPHSMQQSPNKNPQMLHSHSGMHTPNPQHNAHQHNMTAMSPNHNNMNHVQEWSWNNHTVPTGNNEIFNQSDRVNLNTRLKTMILSKNDQKDHDHQNGDGSTSAANQQTSAQTGHFLSYSHHLRDINPTTNDSRCLQPVSTQSTEPIGGGGESIWKPFGYNKPNDFQYAEQKLETSVRKTEYGGTDEIKEKNVKGKAAQKSHTVTENVKIKTEPEKVKPKRQRKKPAAKQTPLNDTANKSSNSDSSHTTNSRQSYSTSNYGIEQIHPPIEPMQQPKPYYLPKEQTNLPVPTPFDPTIKIKQEPMSFSSYNPATNHPVENFDLAQVKMEGYERNYQNFINYADYCQSQNSTGNKNQQQQHSQSESEYPCFNPGYNYPSFSTSGYQPNYPNYNQYTGQQVQQQPMNNEPVPQVTKQEPYLQEQQVKTEPDNKIVLTNYEKEIPVYTYPNPSKISTNDFNQKNEPHKFPYLGEGGPAILTESVGFSCCRQGGTNQPSDEHIRDGNCVGRQTKDELFLDDDAEKSQDGTGEKITTLPSPDRTEKGLKPEVPDCDCFSSDKNPPEPGSYYTHLGSAATLEDLRKDFEQRVGITGRQLRIEKIVYTGKEGKTGQGCPLAKWIIRRVDPDEKILCLVKRRQGHRCQASYIVVCIVAWDGLPKYEADNAYKLLVHKLNKFGLPTTRRCATNENRTCACQGLDPESCGASFSFGCSWSMYYNGCKYARSKTVRKFRLSVKSEEPEIEEHMNVLATILSPLYVTVAPKAYENQCKYEPEAPDCRLGLKPGKPFSGVTTCIDFCAHAHRDLHNMQDGCTVQVGLLRQRSHGVAAAAEDEQLHVLPLYTMDTTDEFGSAEAQSEKNKTGAVQVLEKFPCEVRVRATPLQPCRRHGKKRNGKEVVEEPPPPPSIPVESQPTKKENSKKSGKNKNKQPPASSPSPRAQTPQANNNSSPSANSAFSTPINQNLMNTNTSLINMATMIDNFTDAQLQSNHISSTVLDSPYSYDYTTGSYIDNRNYYNQWPPGSEYGYPDRCEQVKSRGSEENPDSTTLSTANSAFSPKITDPNKFSLLDEGTKDQGFAKPKPPEYPPNYGYHSNKPTYSPMYPPYTPYEHYNNMDYYSNDKLRYNFYSPHHQPYPQYNMYHSNPALSAPSPTPQPNWNMYPPSPSPMPIHPMQPQMQQPSQKMPEPTPTSEPIGEITEINDNLECFQDSQMGGVGIALGHGSVLIECAKHEMHATTALRKPNRLNPTRITLIFYQHRNLNRHKHGIEEWEEKMRLKKLGITAQDVEDAKDKVIKVEEESKEETKEETMTSEKFELDYEKLNRDKEEVSLRAPTLTTTSWTTLFPMHPCVVTGPYQEGNNPSNGQGMSDGSTQSSQLQPQPLQQQQEQFIPSKLNEAYI